MENPAPHPIPSRIKVRFLAPPRKFFSRWKEEAVKPDDCLGVGRRFPQVKAEKERRPPAADGIVSGRVLRSLHTFFACPQAWMGEGTHRPSSSQVEIRDVQMKPLRSFIPCHEAHKRDREGRTPLENFPFFFPIPGTRPFWASQERKDL